MLDILKDYASQRIDLLKMEATEKTSVTAGSISIIVLLSVCMLFFLILLNIGLGLLIGYYLGNYAYGILIMAGFYLLLMLIIFLCKKTIKTVVANKIIQSIND